MEEIAIVRCLQSANGAISKMRVLQAFKDVENFRKILYYALNPMLTYKISEQTLRTPVEYDPTITITMTDIFEICELLSKRKALDAATVYQVRVFVQCLIDPESSEFYIELLSKTLRLGVTAKTVNKVIPGLIPEWEVQQAYPIDKIEQSYLTAEDKGDSPKDESFNIPTSDGKTVRVNIEFSYRFDEARVSETFAMFKGKSGEAIKDSFIKPKVVAWTQEVSANYPVTDIFGDKRTEINAELDTYLREKFDQYGIIIDTVNFTDISVDDETAAAIQKKVTAQQELELANIEKQTAKVQAEKDREVAQINAEKAVIEAEAKAETLRIAAEAEADANRKIAASLTNELIEKIKYEQWNGELPTVTGSTPIISLEP